MRAKPIDWARQYAATTTDRVSLTHVRNMACEALLRDKRLRAEIVEKCGEDVAVREWDPAVAEDCADHRETIRLIDKRLLHLYREDAEQ